MGSLGTNTILAAIPPEMGYAAAKQTFSKFGAIESMNTVPGPSPAVSVSFCDVRRAAYAMQALGGPQYCRPGPPTGGRSVRLHGEHILSEKDAQGVAHTTIKSHDDGSYTVEFYDIRDARRVKIAAEKEAAEQKAAGGNEELEPPPGLEHLAKPPGLKKAKALPVCSGLKDVTNTSPQTRSSSTYPSILVVGLPNMLCSDACFEACLQQASLQDSVVRFATRSGKPCGEAIIWFSSMEAAQSCMTHFQGRRWDNSGKEVKAWVMPHDTSMTDPWSTQRKRCDTGTTISTDVGSTDSEEEHKGVRERRRKGASKHIDACLKYIDPSTRFSVL